jgi:catechol 2,3-dioxygenase-like lactoylglutathione lyase family enzyme
MPRPGARVDGLFEAHLNVQSLDRSLPFYRDVVGLEVAYELPERRVAFVWCGEAVGSMLGLWEQGSMPMALEEVQAAPARLGAHGSSRSPSSAARPRSRA